MQEFASKKQGVRSQVRVPKSDLFLVDSSPKGMTRKGTRFRTGERIPESGIYRVIHREHRLPHEVTLLREGEFPRCARCQDAVQFQLIQAAESIQVTHEFSTRIHLYELPVLEAEQDQSGQIAV